MKARCLFLSAIFCIGWLLAINNARAQGTAFTYQGNLSDGGKPANGGYDLAFTIFNAPTNGTIIGGGITNLATGVTNGLFIATLDFGGGVFTGPARWLQIGVRTNGSTGPFVMLSPRQALTPAPYAVTAATIGGTVPASQLTGTLSSTQLGGIYTNAVVFSNAANTFVGNAAGASNLQAASLTGAVSIANGGTGQTTPAAALSALGAPGLAANNVFSGANAFSYFSLLGSGSRGGVYWTNDSNGALMLSPADSVFNFFINAGHGGAGNGVEWQLELNQMYLGPVNGGHFQFGLGSDTLGDAFVMQYYGAAMSNYTRSHALGWHLKYALGDLFWDSWAETYGATNGVNTSGASVLHFTLPVAGGNQDWHQVGPVSGLTLDSDTGVEIPGYERNGFSAVAPATTNCAINLTNAQYEEFDLTQPAYFYETNLNLFGHFANPVALHPTLLIYSGAAAQPVTFPGNWIWFGDNGAGIAPTNIPAATVMRVDLTVTVGFVTNRLAHYTLGSYLPAYDANALSFFNAAGIININERNAVNTLVTSLKGTASTLGGTLWSRLDAFYPFLGGTAGSASWNLINPGLYQIAWHGSPTFDGNGATGDGATAYGDTGMNPATASAPNYTQNSASFGAYLKTLGTPGGQNSYFGAVVLPARASLFYNPGYLILDGMNSANNDLGTLPAAPGVAIGSRTSVTNGVFLAGGITHSGASTSAVGVPNASFYVLARNSAGLQYPINATEGCFFIGGGLSTTDVGNLNNIILVFVTALGRQ